MLDLNFHVEKAEPLLYAAAPLLVFKLGIVQAGKENVPVHSMALRCQLRIEPTRRRYSAQEQAKLRDLFGEPERWAQTLRAMLWTHVNLMVGPFTGETVVDLPVPCTYDFNVAAMKYFYALEDGAVPVCLLFSGTIFYEAAGGRLQVAQVSWEKEADFKLPVRVWQQMMDHYYPNSAWLCLHRDVLDRLYQYKVRCGLPTWEQTLERLLDTATEQVTS
jgi:hypothetical protein